MGWDGAEKRNFVRADFPCKIVIYTPRKHTLVSHTEDIGAGGVRVIIEENLDIASLVGLEISLSDAQISCKGRIVWVVEKPDSGNNESSSWDTGIEFYEIDEKDKKTIDRFVNTIISKDDLRKS